MLLARPRSWMERCQRRALLARLASEGDFPRVDMEEMGGAAGAAGEDVEMGLVYAPSDGAPVSAVVRDGDGDGDGDWTVAGIACALRPGVAAALCLSTSGAAVGHGGSRTASRATPLVLVASTLRLASLTRLVSVASVPAGFPLTAASTSVLRRREIALATLARRDDVRLSFACSARGDERDIDMDWDWDCD